jgi:hypothetical protein
MIAHCAGQSIGRSVRRGAIAQPVTQRTAGEEQAGEDQGVPIGDPLDVGQRG